MKNIKPYGLLIQKGRNNMLSDVNNPEAWKMYGSDASFRSHINGHILIMDEAFYGMLPIHLRPLPMIKTIVVTAEASNVAIKENVIIARSLLDALSCHIPNTEEKKRFISASPLLLRESVATLRAYDCDEVLEMEKDDVYQTGIPVPFSQKVWSTTVLSTIPQSNELPCRLVFSQHKRK